LSCRVSLASVMVGYSVMSGIGFGFMYIPAVVAAAPYFTKRRALAIGNSSSSPFRYAGSILAKHV
jgi:hypothetical protein